MPDIAGASLGLNLTFFVFATAVIGVGGVAMSTLADRLADRTGLGEAFTGALFLGGSTSLSGTVASVAAAASGHPDLAVSNAVGGIAVQTVFLSIADITYRGVNLEHAAASVPNLTQCAILIALLTVPLLAWSSPDVSVFAVHPASITVVLGYALGLRLISRAHQRPMWFPRRTRETREDVAEEGRGSARSLWPMWAAFAGLALVIGVAGFVIARSAVGIVQHTGIPETSMGWLFTSTATSVPELVTALAAVRRGALELAFGGVIGGNSFDVTMLAFSDVAFRSGSIYATLGPSAVLMLVLPILMTAVLMLGLVQREDRGPANIGVESVVVLTLYAGGVALLLYGL